MPRVLVADDDPDIRELVAHFLGAMGMEVVGAPDGRRALAADDEAPADLAVVDVMMPEMDGWRLCRELKRRRDLPVLMLTALGETSRKLRAFELGADDYLVKPFDPPELGARVKALLKRYRVLAADRLELGAVVLSRDSATVEFKGKASSLPRREWELLWFMAARLGAVHTRGQLIEAVWGMDFDGNERTVDVHLNRLRDRFPEAESGFRIVALRGLGYRLELAP